MTSDLHSTIRSLHEKLFSRWCPAWSGAFEDRKLGGFYERLGTGFKPLATGQRRLLTQLRQLSVYSDFSRRHGNKLNQNIKEKFDYILEKYHDPKTGLWCFSLNDDGVVKDSACDLYTLAFAIFACSHYFRATGDDRAKQTADQVLRLVDTRFRLKIGLAEALAPDGSQLDLPRRQNPHMHLLEACLFAHTAWDDPAYPAMANEMIHVFQNHLFDPARCSLYEFFTPDLRPDPAKTDHLEPGHYLEWVWLLKKHAAMKNDSSLHDPVCAQLLQWANTHGWDETYGGLYDAVTVDGKITIGTKRIWPLCEGLRANALMLNGAGDREKIETRMMEMARLLENRYFKEDGTWIEWLNRDLSPAVDYMPGTTPYHVYFGITETMDTLNRP